MVKTDEVKKLAAQKSTYVLPEFYKAEREVVIFLNHAGDDFIMNGGDTVIASSKEFMPVRFAYLSHAPFSAFWINLVKFVKRRFYTVFPSVYTIKLKSLLDNGILRGERNAQNAYQWGNKKWQISPEEAKRRYEDLYSSIKENGYDPKSPLLVMLNRKLGVKDQMLQGHHRVGICKSLGVENVSVSFWSVPKNYGFLKLFIKRKKI